MEQIISGSYGIGTVYVVVLIGFLFGFFVGTSLLSRTNSDYQKVLMWYMSGNTDGGKMARDIMGYTIDR